MDSHVLHLVLKDLELEHMNFRYRDRILLRPPGTHTNLFLPFRLLLLEGVMFSLKGWNGDSRHC